MAKRFSETKIWEDLWYQNLPIEWKIVWKYLCDKCDEAGIWKINYKLAEFQIGMSINWQEMEKNINNGKERIIVSENSIIITDFVDFQYGEKIFNSNHSFHKKIREMLLKHPKMRDRVSSRVFNTLQEEEEVKDKEKVMEKEEETGGLLRRGVGYMKPPTLLDVREYCEQRRNHVDPERFHDHYTSVGWISGKTPIKDWKALVRKWEKSNYNSDYENDGIPAEWKTKKR